MSPPSVRLILFLALSAAAVGSASEVWPMPVVFDQGSTVLSLSPTNFRISCAASPAVCPDPLPAAFARYLSLIFPGTPPTDPLIAAKRRASIPLHGPRSRSHARVQQQGNDGVLAPESAAVPAVALRSLAASASVEQLVVSVKSAEPLGRGVDESYTLNVTDAGVATISAPNQWGAIRALESFSQLVEWTPRSASGASEYLITNATIGIVDYPRFQWRGLLIDSSRHYLSVDSILRTLDAMSYNKYNTLHWHVIDDNSWPLVSKTYPNFSKAGAYTPEDVYEPEDVQYIVQYAEERGIRVIPEFDMPAHATVWGKGYPDLVISCPTGQPLLDPTGPVYEVFDGLLTEFADVFTQDFIHIGGDEVHSMACWETSAKVQAFAKAHGLKDTNAIRSYFEGQIQAIVAKHGKRAIVWEEVFDGNYNVSSTTAVNVWLSAAESEAVAKAGLNVIHSFGWYLDQQVPPGGTHYFWEDTWQNFYLNDPMSGTLPPDVAAKFLGGEASQWGEQVDDTDIDVRIWPRACATAERLWSERDLRDVNAAFPRISHQRCRLAQRGIDAGPLRPSDTYGYCNIPLTV